MSVALTWINSIFAKKKWTEIDLLLKEYLNSVQVVLFLFSNNSRFQPKLNVKFQLSTFTSNLFLI